jgi:hypothetical protein
MTEEMIGSADACGAEGGGCRKAEISKAFPRDSVSCFGGISANITAAELLGSASATV